jgi:hypothetical protein
MIVKEGKQVLEELPKFTVFFCSKDTFSDVIWTSCEKGKTLLCPITF